MIDRRDLLKGALLSPLATTSLAASKPKPRRMMLLGFSTYGMPKLAIEEAIDEVARIGFDSVEIDTAHGRPADPTLLSKSRRRTTQRKLADKNVILTSMMMHQRPSDPKSVERIKLTAQLAHDLSPQKTPILQTVLGSGKFEEIKQDYVKQLKKWEAAARSEKIVIAIKPHRGGGMSTPSEAAWLIEQLDNSPFIRMVYDYSHYAYRDMSLEQTVKIALPIVAHVAVKDAIKRNGRIEFDLAGTGDAIDFVKLFQLLSAGGYNKDISCEVSSMVWKKPGYNSIKAAETCYRNVSKMFKAAKISRP